MTSSGSGDRVVIDPDDLRRVATRMRGGAEMLSSAARHLASRPRPDTPIGLEARVADVLAEANRELQELALELVQEAQELMGRAAEAELGGIDSIAWLMPRLRVSLSPSLAQSVTLSSSGALLEDRSTRRQRWAEAALDEMTAPVVPSDDAGFDLADFADLVDEPVSGLEEIPPAGGLLDLYLESRGGAEPETGTARGALGVAFDEAELGPTGIGLIACLVAGGADGCGDATHTNP